MPVTMGEFSLGAFAIVLAGVLATNLLTKADRRAQKIDTARDNLREAFNSTLAHLDLERKIADRAAIDTLLRNDLTSQGAAIRAYSLLVPKNKQAEYQKTWDDYCRMVNRGTLAESLVTGEDSTSLFEHKIHEILQFAEEN